jgi:hypothetical protein
MQEAFESKEDRIKRLTEEFRKLLEEKLPDEPGTLEEIERISEEIGQDIKRDVENECVRWHGTGYIGPRAACGCGATARFKNYYDKLRVTLSGELVIQRAYYYCKSCGSGFSPLDEKLEIDSLSTSVGVRTKVGRLASWLPFEEVSVEMRELLGIHVSKNTVERVAEAMGERVCQERQEKERLVLSGMADSPTNGPNRLYVGIDGTGVPMRGGGTHESKTSVIYETEERNGKTLIRHAEYLATLERVESFGDQVYSAAFARGVENAKEVVALGDGALWIWKSFAHHYPRAVQILDFFHASEHLNEVARAWYGEGTQKAKQWVEARECDLLSDCVETVVRSIQSWRPEDVDAQEVRRKNLSYFLTNKQRMRYATFKAHGYHIGSGLVESACKTVVGQRMKQSGMRWSESGAEAILGLRALILTHRAVDLSPYARAIA